MGNDALKTRTPISNAVNTDILNRLKQYSKETSIPLSRLLDKSIELFLKSTKE